VVILAFFDKKPINSRNDKLSTDKTNVNKALKIALFLLKILINLVSNIFFLYQLASACQYLGEIERGCNK